MKETMRSFAEYAKKALPSEHVNLISTFVERIYINTGNDKRFCHIFVKDCTEEDYTNLFDSAGYISHSANRINLT